MTPTMETKQTDAPEEFSEIMELTPEEKRELLKMWKDAHN